VTNQAHDLDEIARKQVLMKLIDHRRQIEDLITMLMGANPEYRRFVDRYNHGSVLSVRELRNYDVPTPDPDEVIERFGVAPAPDTGEPPEWFTSRVG
jgi:hypothetical protein